MPALGMLSKRVYLEFKVNLDYTAQGRGGLVIEMAQLVKALATKPADLREFNPKNPHVRENRLWKLSSDLHIYTTP